MVAITVVVRGYRHAAERPDQGFHTTAAVTVDIGFLPPLPSDYFGYMLVKSADLPLEAIAAEAVTVYPTRLSLPEDGSNTCSVVLNVQPTADVTVGVTSPSGANVSADPAQLTFTASNYNEPQTTRRSRFWRCPTIPMPRRISPVRTALRSEKTNLQSAR